MSRRRGVPHRGTPKSRQDREDSSRATKDARNRNSDGSTWQDHMEAVRAQNQRDARFNADQLRQREQERINRTNMEAKLGRARADRERANEAARDRDQQRRDAMERDRQEAQRRHAETMERRNRRR